MVVRGERIEGKRGGDVIGKEGRMDGGKEDKGKEREDKEREEG